MNPHGKMDNSTFSRGQFGQFVALLKEQFLESQLPLHLAYCIRYFHDRVAFASFKRALLGQCWCHLEPRHSNIRDYHVLSLGKSQGRSDSDGGYKRYMTCVNDKLLSHATYSTVEIPRPNENCTCFCSGVFCKSMPL